MDSILYNQKVTGDIMTKISSDLGNPDFVFSSSEKFGADKLNKITADLVGKGILTTGNKCKVISQGANYYIMDGIAVFSSGAKKTIESNTKISITANTANWVYLLDNKQTNTIDIVTDTAQPATGDYIVLALIEANGTIVDKRTISMAKVALPANGGWNGTQTVIVGKSFTPSADWQSMSVDVQGDSFSMVSTLSTSTAETQSMSTLNTLTMSGRLSYVKSGDVFWEETSDGTILKLDYPLGSYYSKKFTVQYAGIESGKLKLKVKYEYWDLPAKTMLTGEQYSETLNASITVIN